MMVFEATIYRSMDDKTMSLIWSMKNEELIMISSQNQSLYYVVDIQWQ